jgi:hypothetical protein
VAFKGIVLKLQDGDIMLGRLHFVSSVADLFEGYLTKLEKQATLIHILHDELSDVLSLLLQRFVQQKHLTGATGQKLLGVPLEARPVESCDLGAKTKEMLRKLRRDKNERVTLLEKDTTAFVITAAGYLQKKLPLDKTVLQNIKCLQPRLKTDPNSHDMVIALVTALPMMSTAVQYIDKVSTD